MAALLDLKARSALAESIFIAGRLVAWKTENETEFLRIQFAHVESQPVAEEKSFRDSSPLLDSVYEERKDSFQRSFAQLPFLSFFLFFLGI